MQSDKKIAKLTETIAEDNKSAKRSSEKEKEVATDDDEFNFQETLLASEILAGLEDSGIESTDVKTLTVATNQSSP